MDKIRTGITTEAEFRRIVNEKGGNLKINSTPATLVREISNTGSAISYGSPFTEILKSVNDESPLEPIVIEGEDITSNFTQVTNISNVDIIVSSLEEDYNVYVDTRKSDVSNQLLLVSFLNESGEIDAEPQYILGDDHNVGIPFVFGANDGYVGVIVQAFPLLDNYTVDYQDGSEGNVFVDWVSAFSVSDDPEDTFKALVINLSVADEPTVSESKKFSLVVDNADSKMFDIADIKENGGLFPDFMIEDDTNVSIVIKEANY